MELKDLEVMRELTDQELVMQGGLFAASRSKVTNLSTADCVDELTVSMIQAGLDPTANSPIVLASPDGNNIVGGRCVASSNIVFVYAVGSDSFSTQVSRAEAVINAYND